MLFTSFPLLVKLPLIMLLKELLVTLLLLLLMPLTNLPVEKLVKETLSLLELPLISMLFLKIKTQKLLLLEILQLLSSFLIHPTFQFTVPLFLELTTKLPSNSNIPSLKITFLLVIFPSILNSKISTTKLLSPKDYNTLSLLLWSVLHFLLNKNTN